MKNIPIKLFTLAAWTMPVLAGANLHAETNPLPPQSAAPLEHSSLPVTYEVTLDSTYTFAGTARGAGTPHQDSDAARIGFNVRSSVPIDERWRWDWGMGFQAINLDAPEHASFPDEIRTFTFNTGAGYRFNERWFINGMVGATLYRFDDVNGDAVGFNGGLLLNYRPNKDLAWTFGILVSPDSDLPAMPAIGMNWDLNEHWTLELGIPRTRLSYHLDPKWTIYTGPGMAGTTFRTSRHFGSKIGSPRYNNALATYRDVRWGVGATFQISRQMQFEAEAGESLYRCLDYTDDDKQVRFDPAPYVQGALTFRF